MILRVLRARVIEGEEAHFAQFVRDRAVPRALSIPGLLSFQPAVRQDGAGTELVIVSTWTGLHDVPAAGKDLDAPLAVFDVGDMLTEGHAEHYELVIGEARSMPFRHGKLRLTRIPIRANMEAAYYEAVRQWADRLLDETGLVAFSLGRRVVDRHDEIVAAMIFEDEAALREVVGSDLERPMGGRELSTFWAADPIIEHFDAMTAIDPRPDAPAILVTDDDRHYVHATPAAARLSGRPLARLLTLRVDDVSSPEERAAVPEAWERFIAEGSSEGPFVLARPDGTEVEVRFAAKANAPWPGSHASLLVPADQPAQPDDLDVDRALVEAGFVAKYPAQSS